MSEAKGHFIPSFLFIGQGSVLGIPVPVIIMLIVVLIAHLFLEKQRTVVSFI